MMAKPNGAMRNFANKFAAFARDMREFLAAGAPEPDAVFRAADKVADKVKAAVKSKKFQ